MAKSSKQPRKQRLLHYSAPHHKVRRKMSAHLGPEYLDAKDTRGDLKYWYLPRAVPVRKGDAVRILRGALKGQTGKILDVNRKKGYITVEKATMMKADSTQIARHIDPSNVVITKLDLSDKWRKERLFARREEEEEEEEDEEGEED
ncbi:MAG: 50S ribosomal protein L24 [Deltaproteobacteria bacterium]|nr:50S ribosomal protein L24 [Deltaproteobacteria bacterium]